MSKPQYMSNQLVCQGSPGALPRGTIGSPICEGRCYIPRQDFVEPAARFGDDALEGKQPDSLQIGDVMTRHACQRSPGIGTP